MATELVTYTYPVAGTVAPTAAQMAPLSLLVCQVSMVDTSLTVAITHNFGTTLAQGSNQFPLIDWYVQSAGTALTPPALAFALTNSNTVTVTKTSAAGVGGTYVVILQRPNSAIG